MKRTVLALVVLLVLGMLFTGGCKKSAENVVKAKFTLTVTVGDGVSGTPATGTQSVEEGSTISYDFSLEAGYRNLVVVLDNVAVAASGTITINGNRTLSVTCEKHEAVLNKAIAGTATIHTFFGTFSYGEYSIVHKYKETGGVGGTVTKRLLVFTDKFGKTREYVTSDNPLKITANGELLKTYKATIGRVFLNEAVKVQVMDIFVDDNGWTQTIITTGYFNGSSAPATQNGDNNFHVLEQ